MTTEAPATEVPAPQTFKVFAGNLAFATTDDSLKQFFAGSGEVVDAHVVTRGNRSVGYGFVDYPTIELAEKAVQELDKQTLDGRTINVELARAREEGAPAAEGGEGARGPRRRGRGRGRGRGGFRGPPAGGIPPPAGAAAYQNQPPYPPRAYRGGYYHQAGPAYYDYYDGYAFYAPYQGPPRGARAPRPGRRARQHEGEEEPQQQQQHYQPAERKPRQPRQHHQQQQQPSHEGEGEVAHEGEEGHRGERRRGRGGFRRGRGRGGYRGEQVEFQQAPPAEGGEASEHRGRGRRRGGSRGGRRFERKPRDENQEPSATTLFIANLPYDLNEEGLMAVFKDYSPQQARIARARGRSKGFGFIQLENHEFQQKAAAEVDNTEVQGRVLNVKPAVVDLSVQQEPQAEGGDVAEAEVQPAQ